METEEKREPYFGPQDPQVLQMESFLSKLERELLGGKGIKMEVHLLLAEDDPGTTTVPPPSQKVRQILVRIDIIAVSMSARFIGQVKWIAEKHGFSVFDVFALTTHAPQVVLRINGWFNQVDTYRRQENVSPEVAR